MPTKDPEPAVAAALAALVVTPEPTPEPPPMSPADIRAGIRADIDRMNAVITKAEARLLEMRSAVDDKVREYNALGRGLGVSAD